jgi:Type II secretion system (T2SS), protein E, N-terminal domain
MAPRKRLGQLLTEMKIVDEHQLQSALGHQKQWGGKLGAILVQKGFCREDQVVAALSQHLNMPAVRLADVKIDPRAAKMVSRSVAERLHVFAYEVSGSGRSEVITIAMSDPTDLSAVDQLAFHTGKRIKPMLAGDTEVLAAIQKYYASDKAAEAAQAPAPAGVRPFVDGAKAPGGAARFTPIAPMPAVSPARKTGTNLSPVAASTVPAGFEPPEDPPPGPAPGAEAVEPPAEPLDIEGGDLPADAPMDGLEPIAAQTEGEASFDGAEEIAQSNGEAAAADEPVPLEDPSALQGWAEGAQEGMPLETPGSGEPSAAHAAAPAPVTAWGEPTIPPLAGQGTDELPIDAIMGTADVLEQAEATPASADAPDAWSDVSDPLAAQPEPAGGEPMDDAAPAPEPTEDAIPAEAQGGEQMPIEEAPPDGSAPEWEAAAAAIEAAARESEQPEESALPESAGEVAQSVESESREEDANQPGAEENGQDSASAAAASFLESPDDSPAPVDELSIDAAGWSDESAGQDDSAETGQPVFSMASPAEEPPSESDAEVSFDVDTQDGATGGYGDDQEVAATERHGWLLRHREQPGAGDEDTGTGARTDDDAQIDYGAQDGEQAEQRQGSDDQDSAPADSFEEQAYDDQQGDEQQGYDDQQGDEQQEGHEQQEGYDLQEGTDPAGQGSYELGETDRRDAYDPELSPEQSQALEGEESIELATDEGWTGESQDDAQGGAWFGDALSSTTPLSPADLGTLAALGLDPADGAAAQRMLACLVRVLNRRQAIDLDELAAEIRESQMAADAAGQAPGDDPAGEGDPDTPSPDDPANVQD